MEEKKEITINEEPKDIIAEPAEKKPEQKNTWGDRAVTKKFMAIALALTVLVNAGVTAGVLALSGRHHLKGGPEMGGKGRPGSEMFSDQAPNGMDRMTPPSNGGKGPGKDAVPKDQPSNNQDQPSSNQDQPANNQDQPANDQSTKTES